MPRMGGRAVAEQLARRRPHLPVLFMSGYSDDFRGQGDHPMVPFLQKPIMRDQLLDAVGVLLDVS